MAAFELAGEPELLAGGQGEAYRVGDVVLKPVVDAAEAAWTQALLQRVDQREFRCADPVATTDGRWTHAGWIAHRFIPNLRFAAPDWSRVIDAGLRFCDAAEVVRGDDTSPLARRTHRWAVADRVAWHEQHVDLPNAAAELLDQLSSGLGDDTRSVQIIHGDLSGNVFLDEHDTAVILDVSPYVRPRQWCAAIVLVDAVLWNGADAGLLHGFTADNDGRDLVLRALIFRLVAEQLNSGTEAEHWLTRYRRVLRVITASEAGTER